MSDEFDDIFEGIKKYFKIDSDIFDVDFFFFPESRSRFEDFKSKLNKNNVKGFKISYHHKTGMDEPEIKIEGDIEPEKIEEFLSKLDINQSGLRQVIRKQPKGYIDAGDLSLEPSESEEKSAFIEPYTEISDFDGFSEIVIEIPGIEKEDIAISFSNNGEKVNFSASNKNRNYYRTIDLPFKSSIRDYNLDVNNGIAILKVKKTI